MCVCERVCVCVCVRVCVCVCVKSRDRGRAVRESGRVVTLCDHIFRGVWSSVLCMKERKNERKRERERQKDRETERQTERERGEEENSGASITDDQDVS